MSLIAPVVGSRLNIAKPSCEKKTRTCEKSLMMCLAVSIIRPTAEYRRAGAVLGKKHLGGGGWPP